MKTKYILHGGYAGRPANPENDNFFKEVLKSAPKKTKVLLVYFAKEADRIAINKREDVLQFKKNKGNKNISFEVAKESSFHKQVITADVIYLHGGDTLKLIDTLKKFSDIKKLFKGKIVAGESAGAYALSSCFYSERAGGIFKGLGLVPVKTICHYSKKKKGKLKGCPKELKTLLLADYQYKFFNI